VIVSLMTVGRVASGLVALDSGTAQPGLAAQGCGMRAILAEPALLLAAFSLAPGGGSFNLDSIIDQQREGIALSTAASAVTLSTLLVLVFTDASSVDRGLDQMLSGTDLAIARMTGWLRRLIWIDLIVAVFLPVGMATADSGPLAWPAGLLVWAIKLGIFTLGLSGVLTTLGRMPGKRLRDLTGIAALLALLATMMTLASTGLV
jgi:formate hydrogenlyase subunit 4